MNADKAQEQKQQHEAAADDDDSDDDADERVQYKIVVLGNGAVGKTSLISRFTSDTFAHSYKQTIGVDFFIKRVSLPCTPDKANNNKRGKGGSSGAVSEVEVSLQIWDIGGQTIGSAMVGNYIFGAHAVLLAYDVTNYQSFQDLDDWLTLVRRTYQGEPMPYVALVGNKIDLPHLRVVKSDTATRFMNSNSLSTSHLISAKTGDHTHHMFTRIAADLAGVQLTRSQVDGANAKPDNRVRVMEAVLVNHQQHDPKTNTITLTPQKQRQHNKAKCAIM